MSDNNNEDGKGFVGFQLSDGRVIMISAPDEVLIGLAATVLEAFDEAGIKPEVQIGLGQVQVIQVDGAGEDADEGQSYTAGLRARSMSAAYL